MALVRTVVAGLLTAAASCCWATLPKDVQEFLGAAASLPVEMQAQVTLRIVESGRGLTLAQKQELLEDAFAEGGRAMNPIRRIEPAYLNADSRQAMKAKALSLGLDRLSLQMQAVQAMIHVNAREARELFQQLQRPVIEKLTCEDALVPEVGSWYETAGMLSQSAFSQKEMVRQDHVALLMTMLAGVQSHYDLAPAGRMIALAPLTNEQLEAVLTAYAARLEAVTGEDRAFAMYLPALRQTIRTMAGRPGAREVLAPAFRKYVLANYGGAHCEDTAQRLDPDLGEWFKQVLRSELPVIPVRTTDAKTTPEGRMKVDEYWKSEPASRLMSAARELRGAPQGLEESLALLNGFEASSEASELDYFHEKALVLESLLDIVPEGESRAAVTGLFVAHLSATPAREQNPTEWLWHVQFALSRLRQAGKTDAAAKLMAAYQGSGDEGLAFIARFSAGFALFN